MNNVIFKKTMLTTTLLLILGGLYGSSALATPDCNPDNSEQTNTPESKRSGAIAEAIDIQITDLPDKINSVIGKPATASEVKYYSFTALRGQKDSKANGIFMQLALLRTITSEMSSVWG